MDLASFGIQIKNTAQMHHSKCFVGNGPLITDHPLREVVEWNLRMEADQDQSNLQRIVIESPWRGTLDVDNSFLT
eukprot:3856559-Rhodomonas_salina.1